VNRPPRALAGQMLAYVDDCLAPEERKALEIRMTGEPETKRQIERWRLQNEAIRAAFCESSAAARNFAAEPGPAGVGPLREAKAPERRQPRIDPAGLPLRKIERAPPARALAPAHNQNNGARLARRISFTLAAVLAAWAAGAIDFSGGRSAKLVMAAMSAYGAFAEGAARPVEIATSDRVALDKWFAAQIGRAAPVPDLGAAGQVLLGGRIVPGAFSAAQFVIYENARRERIGLEIEALDAPAASEVELYRRGEVVGASWTGAGHGFAMIGRASGAPVVELARLAREEQRRD
jgi:anti-sigma factor RsiW